MSSWLDRFLDWLVGHSTENEAMRLNFMPDAGDDSDRLRTVVTGHGVLLSSVHADEWIPMLSGHVDAAWTE